MATPPPPKTLFQKLSDSVASTTQSLGEGFKKMTGFNAAKETPPAPSEPSGQTITGGKRRKEKRTVHRRHKHKRRTYRRHR